MQCDIDIKKGLLLIAIIQLFYQGFTAYSVLNNLTIVQQTLLILLKFTFDFMHSFIVLVFINFSCLKNNFLDLICSLVIFTNFLSDSALLLVVQQPSHKAEHRHKRSLYFQLFIFFFLINVIIFIIFFMSLLFFQWKSASSKQPVFEELSENAKNQLQKCSICLQDLTQGCRISKCGHSFHKQCIYEWVGQKQNCPDCRQSISLYE